tara:strand:- start:1877 stop:2464 length:588 start_codon:yes stop_codon:yes gene_type:complete
MVKLNGKKKLRISVFISGRGSNLKSIIKFSKKKNSPFKISLVITNNKKAHGINFAKKNKIKYFFINYKNKNKAEKQIKAKLYKHQIDFICLAGFMKILSKNIVNSYKDRILNIHPSLLPKYKGLNTHQRVLKKNEKFTGCTVHLVNSQLDSGKIILQKKVRVLKNDNELSLSKRVLKVENLIYPEAIKKYINSIL